jgi:transcription elongation GreA/GreB family factor
MKELKEILVNQLKNILDKRIETANSDIQLAKESRDNETKSTAGDKYETGRAMVQFELEKNKVQLNKAIQLKNELAQIDIHKKFNKSVFGSIVKTTQDNYFISIGLGKINVGEESFFAISLASPIGMILNNKKEGDFVNFPGKTFTITEIL